MDFFYQSFGLHADYLWTNAAQNKGNQGIERIRMGVKKGFQYCLTYSVVSLVLVNIFLPCILPMFISGKQIHDVLSYAKIFT